MKNHLLKEKENLKQQEKERFNDKKRGSKDLVLFITVKNICQLKTAGQIILRHTLTAA